MSTESERFLQALDDHKKIVFKVAQLYCRNPADRQELAQEIVTQLWRSFGRFDGRSKLSTWMYRVALNVAISHVRDERRRGPTVPLEDVVLEAPAVAPDGGEVTRLLGRLGELDRALILLYVEGHDQQSIAEVLGISATHVGTKIGRIKSRLRAEAAEGAAGKGHEDGSR